MIRKILFFVCLIFAVLWFSASHIIKREVTLLIKSLESDNIKISYEDIKISSFPKFWQISIISPKVNFIDRINSKEFSTKELNCYFDLSFKKANLVFRGGVKKYADLNGQKSQYLINSNEDISGVLKFNKPLYALTSKDRFDKVVKYFKLLNSSLIAMNEDKEVFRVSNLSLLVNKNSSLNQDSLLVDFEGVYNGQDGFLDFNSADLKFDTILTVNKEEDESISPSKKFVVNNFNLLLESGKVNFYGSIEVSKGSLPEGKFFISLNNYRNIIDKLIPSNFIISKPILKKMVANAIGLRDEKEGSGDASLSNNSDAEFDVEFSNEGIRIGSLNLMNFKGKE